MSDNNHTGAIDARISIRVTLAIKKRLEYWAYKSGMSPHSFFKAALLRGGVSLAKDYGVYEEEEELRQ